MQSVTESNFLLCAPSQKLKTFFFGISPLSDSIQQLRMSETSECNGYSKVEETEWDTVDLCSSYDSTTTPGETVS